MASFITNPVPRVMETQHTILPRQIITQTITNDDYTTTAVVTLGPGNPSSVPPISSDNSQGSTGLSSSDIGIIIGSVAGAVVLALIIWTACVIRRRMIEEEIREYENESQIPTYDMMQRPRRPYWPRFPTSIPPPAEPEYWATPPRRTYTSNGVGRRATTSYIFYDDPQRR